MKNVYDIKCDDKLNFVLSSDKTIEKTTEKKEKVAVVVHMHYTDMVEDYLHYIEAIPNWVDIYFTVSSDTAIMVLCEKGFLNRDNCYIVNKENRGRDISSLLVGSREIILKYDYFCFIHDKKAKTEKIKDDVKKWLYSMWENMLGSKQYISNVIELLTEEKDVGVLAPPFPLTERMVWSYKNGWSGDYELTVQLAERLQLNCNLDKTKPPITLGTVFWAKVDALRKLLEIDWKYEDFDPEPMQDDGTISHAIERIFAYVAQDAGYKTGWVMSDRYAGEYIEHARSIISKALYRMGENLGIASIADMNSYDTRINDLILFCNKHEKVYIYGAGHFGKECAGILQKYGIDILAFLVSDSSDNKDKVNDIQVIEIEKANISVEAGIVIAVSEKYYETILRLIQTKNKYIDTYFYMYNADMLDKYHCQNEE